MSSTWYEQIVVTFRNDFQTDAAPQLGPLRSFTINLSGEDQESPLIKALIRRWEEQQMQVIAAETLPLKFTL